MVYIAGSITWKGVTFEDDVFLYYEKFGVYSSMIGRGELECATDFPCQWTIFAFVIFSFDKDLVCCKSLSDILMQISEAYSLKSNSRTYYHALKSLSQ